MNLESAFIQSKIPLLPDADLLAMIDEMLADPPSPMQRVDNREEQAQITRNMEAISREIKARGMASPPWWSADRRWELEDMPVKTPGRHPKITS